MWATNRRRIMRARFFIAIIGTLLAAGAARAENVVLNAQYQEILIKTAILTFNDANLTGNYSVFHAKLAKPFRDEFSPDKLKQVFKDFHEKKVDLGAIVLKPPVPSSETIIDKRGALILRGYFETSPSRVHYDLDFAPSENEWKPIKIHVRVKPADGK
jgi:hypothetical protein